MARTKETKCPGCGYNFVELNPVEINAELVRKCEEFEKQLAAVEASRDKWKRYSEECAIEMEKLSHKSFHNIDINAYEKLFMEKKELKAALYLSESKVKELEKQRDDWKRHAEELQVGCDKCPKTEKLARLERVINAA